MEPMKKEENINKPKFKLIVGGKGTDVDDPNWLSKLSVGQWFISSHNQDPYTNELWMLKFKFKECYLLYTNMNIEFRKLVKPMMFSKHNTLVELLDLETT